MSDSKDNIYYRELNTVLKFSSLINSSLKIETVLDYAMKCAEEFINAEASTIYEIDDEKSELFIRLARGEKKDPVKNIRIKIGDGIAGHVVESGIPMVINDVQKEKRFNNRFDLLTGFKTRSMICVPLMLRGKKTGAIQVLNKKTGEHFNESDMEILNSLSMQIAVAIENARLYEMLEQKFASTARELKNAEEKLIRAERIAAMGHLVNSVAHEIRNPVTVIGGFARRLKDNHGNDPEVSKYSEIILGETLRLERLVKQVHRLAEVQTSDPSPGSIVPVIEKTVKVYEPQAKKRNIDIKLSVEKDLPDVNIDESQMFTAFSNIFENALESMNGRGQISFMVKTQENHILIDIDDTGSGIEDDEIAFIYDPFVTSKTTGVGLGLTMVHQIVTNHGGE
ncbi:MAG: GAF domain-containing protein, partial [Desulfobacteraceae bacterium]